MKLQFKISTFGFVMAGLYLLLVLAVIGWLFYSASTNPADSGEGGVLIVFLAMPWISLLPSSLISPWTALGSILLNGLLIYCIFGGVRLSKV